MQLRLSHGGPWSKGKLRAPASVFVHTEGNLGLREAHGNWAAPERLLCLAPHSAPNSQPPSLPSSTPERHLPLGPREPALTVLWFLPDKTAF